MIDDEKIVELFFQRSERAIQELDSNSLKVSFYEPPAADSVEIRVISAERVEIADIPDNIEIGPENLSSDCFMTAEEITAIIGE